MLSIKAICKSENNEEVVIIGFELEGYCLCMTKSGTIFHAKHEDLTIVDERYLEACNNKRDGMMKAYKNEEKFYGIKSFISRLFELANKNKSFIAFSGTENDELNDTWVVYYIQYDD
jgi:hypothetical protein